MKIKHWQGYGSVNAKRIKRTERDGLVDVHIQVRGNHEWGIERDDRYDFVNWLGKKFTRDLTDYRQIQNLRTESSWDSEKSEDVCDYYVTYCA